MKRDLRKAEEEEHWKVKTTAKMGGLCEERYKKGSGGRPLESKDHC